ncbi:MAG TPA: hypothetical protein VMJ75_07225 [Candidatus Acidoferrales bacterium]|nr:hypothetical protein [Candidatus Acidoferrales bacterium]
MENTQWFKGSLVYFTKLVEAGFEGISVAKRENNGTVFVPPLKTAVWVPMATGAFAGAVGTRWKGNRKGSTVAIGGLVGSLVGLVTVLGWTSRRFAGNAAKRASHNVNKIRDAHWLDTHPIDYA